MPTHTGGDAVTHPSHYNWHPAGIECREVVRYFGFNTGNAIKYIWRAGWKDSRTHVEDLRKAIDYLQDEIDLQVKAEQDRRAHADTVTALQRTLFEQNVSDEDVANVLAVPE